MRSLVFPFFAILMLIASCQAEPFLTSNDSSSYNIESTASTNVVSFSTNVSWVAKSSDSWLKVSPSSGSGGEVSITISADENPNYDSRTASISVTAGELIKTFSFTQAAKNGYVLRETNFEIGSDGGSISIPVQANIDYSVSIDDNSKSWLTIIQTKALSDNTIILTAAKNDTYDSRTGIAYVSYGTNKTTLTILQSQLDELIVGTKSFEIGSEGGEISVPVQSNIEYKAEVLGTASEWISISSLQTKSLDNYSLVLKVANNETYDGRVGQIKVYGAGKESIVNINQSQNNALLIDNKLFEISSDAQTIEVNVNSNVDYTYSIQDSWIKDITTKSLASTKILFAIDENVEYETREGQIVFKSIDGKYSETISIRQDKYVPEYVLSKQSSTIIEGETDLITISLKNGKTPTEQIIWSSNNDDIASVTSGKITAKSEGHTIITATGKESGLTASCNVNVVKEFDILIAYYDKQAKQAYYQRNGNEFTAPSGKGTEIIDIKGSNGHVYLLSSKSLWVDGVEQALPNGFYGQCLCIDNDDVYIGGTANVDGKDKLRILKNGSIWENLASPYEEWMVSINDMSMSNGTMYVSAYVIINAQGYSTSIPVYWKGTECVIIHDTGILSYSSQEEVSSICAYNGNAYALWGDRHIASKFYININGSNDISFTCNDAVKISVDDSYIYVAGTTVEKISSLQVGVPYLWVFDINTKQLVRQVCLNYSGNQYTKSIADMSVINGVAHIVGSAHLDSWAQNSVGVYWVVDGNSVSIVDNQYMSRRYTSINTINNRK